jgi:hypothetical protein
MFKLFNRYTLQVTDGPNYIRVAFQTRRAAERYAETIRAEGTHETVEVTKN